MSFLKKLATASENIYILIIILFGLLAFSNMLGNSFVWDDEEMVVKNFPLFRLENIPSLFKQATFFSGGATLSGWFYRPLVMTLFLLISTLFGQSPFGFHLVQLFLHLANSVLIFLIFKKLFEKEAKDLANIVAFGLALIFAVHPGNVEAVSYIASLAEPLYTLFLLLLFYLVLAREKVITKWTLLSGGILFTLALFTKENSVVFLVILFSFLYLSNRNALSWIGSLFTALAFYLFIRLNYFGVPSSLPKFFNPIGNATLLERLLTLPFILLRFLKTFFFPYQLAISQHAVVRNLSFDKFWVPTGLVIVFLMVSLGFLYKTKSKLGIFFLIWFIVAIIPSTNILFPLDMTFAERWLYFPMIGLLGFLGVILLRQKNLVVKNIKVFLSLTLIILVSLSIRTIVRNQNWHDGLTLFSHDITISKGSFDLENNLGVELFRTGQIEEAKKHFENSISLQPKWYFAYNNLGATYEREGNNKKAKELYQKTLSLSDYYLAYENLAGILLKENPKEAENFSREALKRLPQNARLWLILAAAQDKQGKNEEAQQSYSVYLNLSRGGQQ